MAEIRRSGELIEVRVGRRERQALAKILERLEPMLEESRWTNSRAYEDDAEEEEFQRLVGSDLEQARADDLAVVRSALEADVPIRLDVEQTWRWLRSLNFLRLALAERLGIEEDGWEEKYSPREHRRPPLATLHLLSWVQEELVEALASG
ncbi:MAG TPA: DUF2017 family protein [Candidatus Nanopelagicaceae bacterium]|nr:DUF2017 family protein [Candidatus Nanopelagicaceae bacterium]